jgi:hypothetical protein
VAMARPVVQPELNAFKPTRVIRACLGL